MRSLALSCAYLASCAAPGRRALVAHGVLQWLGSYVSADVTSSSSSTSYSSVTAGELQEGALGDVSSESASYVYACLLNNMAQVDALATITLTVYAWYDTVVLNVADSAYPCRALMLLNIQQF